MNGFNNYALRIIDIRYALKKLLLNLADLFYTFKYTKKSGLNNW